MNISVVPADDARNRCKSDAGSPELPVAMETLKCGEEFFSILHVEARAVILNVKGFRIRLLSKKDLSVRRSRCKFDGVPQQIMKGYAQQTGIGTRS